VAVVIAIAVGVVVALGGEERNEPGGVAAAPTGPAVARLEVHALPTLKFQADEFTTSAGVNEIEFVDFGGTHALVFEDPALSYFGVSVPVGPNRGKVELEAGRDYRIFCVIPGHRAAGMEAVIHVAPPSGSAPAGYSEGAPGPL
jgi:plastocyanin